MKLRAQLFNTYYEANDLKIYKVMLEHTQGTLQERLWSAQRRT